MAVGRFFSLQPQLPKIKTKCYIKSKEYEIGFIFTTTPYQILTNDDQMLSLSLSYFTTTVIHFISEPFSRIFMTELTQIYIM